MKQYLKKLKKVTNNSIFIILVYYKPRQKSGLVVWKDDIANLYLLIKIGSSSNKNNKPLSNVLSSQSTPHFIYSRPFLDLYITKELKTLCELIQKSKPIET